MFQVDGAVIKEQGITFAVVVVKRDAVVNQFKVRDTMVSFSSCFPGMPVVLMCQDHRGVATYYGRPDIAKFLARISPSRIPWKRYTFN